MSKTTKFREFDRLRRLERRAEWLTQRSQRVKHGGLAYDLGELSALEWAIPVLEAYLLKKYTAKLDLATLKAVKHEIPDHLYQQLLEAKSTPTPVNLTQKKGQPND